MSGHVPEWLRGSMSKTSAASPKQGVRQMGSLFHGAKVQKFADGSEGGVQADEATLKAEGLEASNKELAGKSQFEQIKGSLGRLFEGSIDDPSSEAYRKYGAGRGRTERDFKAADKQMDQLEATRKANEQRAADREKEYDAAEKQIDTLDRAKTTSAPAKPEPAKSEPSKSSGNTKFGEAFSAARKSGAKDFEWNGKKYTTEVKEGAGKPANKPATKVKPSKEIGYGNDSSTDENWTNNRGGAAVAPGGNRLGRAAARKRAESAK